MKTRDKLIEILRSKRGEMLLESVISLFILTLVVLGASGMIVVSTEINKSSQAYTKAYYDEYNSVLSGVDIPSTDETEMNITMTYYIDKKISGSDSGNLSQQVSMGNKLTVTNRGIVTID